MDMLSSANELARSGFKIVPFTNDGDRKRPLSKHGFKDATRSEIQIKEWWKQYPRANVAIATGRYEGDTGALVVIDADLHSADKNGLKSLEKWQEEHGAFPETVKVRTGGGGVHFYYLVNNDDSIKGLANILPGVDIRFQNQGVVAPPSIHPNGNAYKWLTDKHSLEDVAQANGSVLRLLHYRNTTKTAPTFVGIGGKIPTGARNNTLYRMCRAMQESGFSDRAILAAIMVENDEHCEKPLEEKELFALVKSALSNEKGNPRETKKQKRKRELMEENIEIISRGLINA